MAAPSPRELLAQLQTYTTNPPTEILNDRSLRKDLYEAAQRFQFVIEETPVAMHRLLVRSANDAALKIAFDLGLFPYIGKGNAPKSLKDLESSINADSQLLLRLLRTLAANGMLTEVGTDQYALAPSWRLFGDQTLVDAAGGCEKLVAQVFAALPAFLAETGYRNPTDRNNGPANKAFAMPNADLFEIIKTKFPEAMQSFGYFLGAISQDSAKPQDIYPIEDRIIEGAENSPDGYFWVDIGGGMGAYTAAVQSSYLSLPGKCVVQEQELMVGVAKSKGADQHVNFMAHDFFDEQPVKGARAYFYRNIFHNWSDDGCKLILARVTVAMKPGYSRLLINDLVIPDRGASQWEAGSDWLMMMGYSAHERSETQWRELLRAAGLRINRVYQKSGLLPIIEAELGV